MFLNLLKILRKKSIFITPKKPFIPKESFYDLRMKKINGDEILFQKFKGKKVLIVNTASQCGFTKQYAALEELYQKFSGNLEIIAFPCNDFLFQEPKSNTEIAEFCSLNYGVSFVLSEKITLHKGEIHPVFKWLTQKDKNGWNSEKPSWNFCKYLIDEKGELRVFANSLIDPLHQDLLTVILK